MAKYQNGSLRQERRKGGMTWVLRFYVTKAGRRVEHTLPIGTVDNFPTLFLVKRELERQQLLKLINGPDFQGPPTFEQLANHWVKHELDIDQDDAVISKASSTVAGYKRNLRRFILPRWGIENALGIQPLEIEQWLQIIKRTERLANPITAS